MKFSAASVLACALLAGWQPSAVAQTERAANPASPASQAASATSSVSSQQQALPPSVEAALQRAKVPREALSAMVVELDAPAKAATTTTRLAFRADEPANPASVMKLITTYAALDLLGPAFQWETPVYFDAQPQDGALRGNVYIQGGGDPQLVLERLWLTMRRLRAMGVTVIVGDIVLDRSAFDIATRDAAKFDGEPWRPYNVAPDALLINFKAMNMRFVPDAAAGVARISYEPPMGGMQLPATVPLAAAATACGDWQGGLKAELAEPGRISFLGSFPSSCGEREWAIAPADPDGYAARAIEGMWRELGGKVTGTVRDGRVPAGLKPVFSNKSLSLAEVIRDINKYSNNVMTQQLFLTLGLQATGRGTWESGRQAMNSWWRSRWPQLTPPVWENGAGLSREERVTARALSGMLQTAWASPQMPELLSSLPIVGVDGTMRRVNTVSAKGMAHLKTGTLRDVTALAGVVNSNSGKRYVLVGMINHPLAPNARPALHALVDWVAQDTPAIPATVATNHSVTGAGKTSARR
nr:D-alanyl-D-alanine carboxypeptidase/D-alanyl-D-alanine-endopeptidase [Diaphorobacter caeni]